ncbi:kinase-like protein [Heliocybe sulcata]|uniref:Kinase-like protein n=1 Tax=Heliocybe sulcata TaxID=5364 RepID=A0A5C3N9F6_9AGAM|nr:kinase-like protein [Heliocybe sulcata]
MGVFQRNAIKRLPSSHDNIPTTSAFACLPHPHAIPLSLPSASTVSSIPRQPSVSCIPPSPKPSLPPSPIAPPQVPKHVPRSPYLPSPVPRTASIDSPRPPARRFSTSSSFGVQDILYPGDVVGEGLELDGETVRLVPIDEATHVLSTCAPQDAQEPVREFEVMRRLGTGSYAVVYLVREVLSRSSFSDNGHMLGAMELDDAFSAKSLGRVEYGREFAIKCLSKANLDEEALEAQMTEVTIHQSLPAHPNIVTLHRTFETDSYLLLLLEFVPGEDLFYFLEQSRDHYSPQPPSAPTTPPLTPSPTSDASPPTPPTPGLLGSHNPTTLLSRTRLKLVASMFAQMCEAVAACHDVGVFHRDIKPENFIVTDRWEGERERERKVVVKLSDFGLSTRDWESSDMDCGSAPYMSFECRNNVAPTYLPRGADVWSLGIVLINMLYHFNPWTDTTEGVCSSFTLFRQHPVPFLLGRFPGMTEPVARYLAENVFCILDDPQDDSQRVSAGAFGKWARDLPALFGVEGEVGGHRRVVSVSSVQGHPISSVPCSRRPSSRQASRQATGTLGSRQPSLGPALEEEERSVVIVEETVPEVLEEEPAEVETASRCTSTTKRRKRGARKGKGAKEGSLASPLATNAPSVIGVASGVEEENRTSEMLASASQALARELSRTSRSSSFVSSFGPGSPTESFASIPSVSPPVSKKASKWKLGFGRTSSTDRAVEMETGSSYGNGKVMSATASNVTSLIMGLEAPAVQHHSAPADRQEPWARGRQTRGKDAIPVLATPQPPVRNDPATWGPSSRGVSPTSTRSGRQVASSSIMTGMPWELHELPRQLHPKPVGDIFGQPPVRKARTRKPNANLDTISERPGQPKSPLSQSLRQDAATSTTDLHDDDPEEYLEGSPKKVQKGQINALAKMLSALRR